MGIEWHFSEQKEVCKQKSLGPLVIRKDEINSYNKQSKGNHSTGISRHNRLMIKNNSHYQQQRYINAARRNEIPKKKRLLFNYVRPRLSQQQNTDQEDARNKTINIIPSFLTSNIWAPWMSGQLSRRRKLWGL